MSGKEAIDAGGVIRCKGVRLDARGERRVRPDARGVQLCANRVQLDARGLRLDAERATGVRWM